MKRVRLFHFDIPTWGNYGDKALYPVVRDLFAGYGAGRAFHFVGSAPLRKEVSHDLVDHINDIADAVVVGGGGLFLQDTNPNRNSGWQWNISQEALERLDVPIVLFSVGNNRFPGQPDFDELFVEHVSAVGDRAVFFGLRNHGSIDSISSLLPTAVADAIGYQPCPTTLASLIYDDPKITVPGDERSLAIQMLVHQRQIEADFDAEGIYRETLDAAEHLHDSGWDIWNVPFHPDDRKFSTQLAECLPEKRTLPLHGYAVDYRDGIRFFSRIPFVLGARGHAQLVPFGVGSIPLSVALHDKLRFFADDIGHPELVLDPSVNGLAQRIVTGVERAWDHRAELRADLNAKRTAMFRQTLENLAEIYRALGGASTDGVAFEPVSTRLADAQSFHVRSVAGAEEERIILSRSVAQARRSDRERLQAAESEIRAAAAAAEAARGEARDLEHRYGELDDETGRIAAELTTAHAQLRAVTAELEESKARTFQEDVSSVVNRATHGVTWRARRIARRVGKKKK